MITFSTGTYLADSGQPVSYTTLECAQSPLLVRLLGTCHCSALESLWGWDGKKQRQKASEFNLHNITFYYFFKSVAV